MRRIIFTLFSSLLIFCLYFSLSRVSFAVTPYEPEASLSAKTLNPDGTTTYMLQANIHVEPTFDHYGPPPSQVINYHEALINETGANAGQYRGHFRWSYSGSGLSAGKISCTCGNQGQCTPSPYPSTTSGYADIEPGVLGSQYVQLVSCTVWANGVTGQNFSGPANHVTQWVFKALPLWGTTGPYVNNTVSSRGTDIGGRSTSYKCQENTGAPCFTFDILNTSPSNITVTELSMTPSNRYTGTNGAPPPSSQGGYITMKIFDPDGGNDVKSAYIRINLHGVNGGQYRGYFGWSTQGFPGWNGNYLSGWVYGCSGGGSASTYNGFGQFYIWPGTCVTSVSGNVRTIQIGLQLGFNYTSPLVNTLSGWAMDGSSNVFNWAPFGTFNVAPQPTVTSSINVSPVKTDGLTTYTVTLNGYNYYGGPDINYLYSQTNMNQGMSMWRGFANWLPDFRYPGDPTVVRIPCSGGGGYLYSNNAEPQYVYTNLISCTNVANDTNRIVTYNLSFNPVFTTPVTGNVLNALVATNIFGCCGSGTNGTFNLIPTITTATFSGKITDGSSCAAGAPAIAFDAGNNIYDTQVPATTAPINSSGNYSLSNVTVQPTNTICTNLANPPGGGYYRLTCATTSSGTASISGNCANVTGATGSAVTVNMGYSIVQAGGWFETILGDVYTNCNGCSPSISRGVPPQNAASPFVVEPFLIDIAAAGSGSPTTTGLAIAKGDIVVKDSSNNPKVSNDSKKGTDASSNNFKNLQVLNYTSNGGGSIVSNKVVDFVNGPTTATSITTTSTPSCASFLTAQRVARVYKMNAACFSTMMGAADKTYDFSAGVGGGQTAVIYITGSGGITFNNKLTAVGNSRLVLVVEGDVTIARTLGAAAITQSTVGDIQATIVSKGNIVFQNNATPTDSSIVIDGSLITLSDTARINFARDRGANNDFPAELIRFKAKDMVDLTNLELTTSNLSETGLFINDVRWTTQ